MDGVENTQQGPVVRGPGSFILRSDRRGSCILGSKERESERGSTKKAGRELIMHTCKRGGVEVGANTPEKPAREKTPVLKRGVEPKGERRQGGSRRKGGGKIARAPACLFTQRAW